MDPTILLLVVALYLVWVAVRLAWRWLHRPSVGAEVLAELDGDPELEGFRTTSVARRTAYEFKAEFGELRYNNANRCIAAEWVRRKFRSMDMRYVDIVRHMDVCVELCLTPTAHAVAAAEVGRTNEVRARRAAVNHAK